MLAATPAPPGIAPDPVCTQHCGNLHTELFVESPRSSCVSTTTIEAGAMPRVERGDRVSLAYNRLRELIVLGRLAPGTRIIETSVAVRLGVSRTPVRAARSEEHTSELQSPC